jgi:hypothetical protein
MVEHRHLPHVSSFRDNSMYTLQPAHISDESSWLAHYILMPVTFISLRVVQRSRAADGGLDANVKERRLAPAGGRPEHCPTYLATGLFRSLSLIAIKLCAEMELCGAKCPPRGTD